MIWETPFVELILLWLF